MMMPRAQRDRRRLAVEADRDVAHPRRELGADDLGGALEVDVLVVVAGLGLGRRREDRRRQLRRVVRSPGGSGTPQTRPLSWYSFQPLPAR